MRPCWTAFLSILLTIQALSPNVLVLSRQHVAQSWVFPQAAKFLICSMPKLVPFLASPERNFEHRHRQPELVASDQQVWSPRLHASRRWSNRLRRSWDRREERAVRPRSSGDVLADPQPLLGDGGRDGNRLRARLENERPPPAASPLIFQLVQNQPQESSSAKYGTCIECE